MKTLRTYPRNLLLGAMLTLAAPLFTSPALRAADHGDAPTAAHDQAADIGDLYCFLDPTDNTKLVLIATVHGFIVPAEAANFAIFDPAVRYHFEIENTGDAKPDKFIDVTFSQRVAADGPAGKEILQVPQPQQATVKISGVKGSFTATATNPSPTAPTPLTVTNDPVTSKGETLTGVSFAAGMVDDPFFFDIPAFARFIGSVRNGAPDATFFNRGRDSFAGYNILAIAVRIPVAGLLGAPREENGDGKILGISFATQRKSSERLVKGERKGSGGFKNVDREGLPAVNVALVPFNRKNEYNAATTRDDAKGKFAGDIVATLQALGTNPDNLGILAQVAVLNGDILRLDTSLPNAGAGSGIGANGFPNGRRLADDVIDAELTLIANGNPFDANTNDNLGDNVNANDVPFLDAFPFLGLPQPPRNTGVTDDNTRN